MSRRGTDLGDYNAGGKERLLPEDLVEVLKLPKRKWVQVRLVGSVYTYGGYWVKTKAKSGKEVSFFTAAPSYNPETQARDEDVYDPWRDAAERINTKDNRRISFTRFGWMNVIVRSIQKDAPRRSPKPTREERKTGFKDKDSETFTPFRALRMTSGLIGKIQNLQGLNTVTSKKSGRTQNFPVTHERYGMDVMLYFDPDADSPGDMYAVQAGRRTRLTDEEKAYLQWDLTKFEEKLPEAEIRRDFESWAKRNGVKLGVSEDVEDEDLDEDEDGFEEDEKPRRKARKSSKKASKKSSKKSSRKKEKDLDEDDWEDSDDDDLDEDDGWDDEEEDEKPKPKRKPKKSAKKASKKKPAKKSKAKVEDDEDEDDDWDDEDDEEDEKPKRKSKKSSKKASKKKSKAKVEDDDEDDDWDSDEEDGDEDDWDEEEEDEKPKRKSKKTSKKKSKTKVEEDEDEDDDWDSDDDDDDDEDDLDEDDDDDDDDDDDWDSDDEDSDDEDEDDEDEDDEDEDDEDEDDDIPY